MIKGRIYRIFSGIVYPSIIGWMIFFFVALFHSSSNLDSGDVKVLLLVLIFTYMYLIVPSILFSLSMEFLANRYITNDVVAITMAGIVGLLNGYSLGVLYWQIGLVTGLLVGWHLRRNYKKSVAKHKVNSSS